jgi:hypothetical protein
MCDIDEAPNTPHVGTLEWVQSLVHDADLILRARALRYGEGDHYLVPPDAAGGGVRAIEFEVLENLTPTSGTATAPILYIGGYLTNNDDFNRGPVPYLHVRSSGQRGSCFASEYRRGGEFLLLLRLAPSGYYTPYWALLSPVNEQMRGADDPWIQWVRRQRASLRRHTTHTPNDYDGRWHILELGVRDSTQKRALKTLLFSMDVPRYLVWFGRGLVARPG